MKKNLIYIFLMGMITCCQSLLAQTGNDMIRGKVSSDDGEELISAIVVEIDKTDRVVGNVMTDVNGEFSMRIKNPQNRLKVTYLGFGARILNIGQERFFNVIMTEKNILQEVVVTSRKTVSSGMMDIPAKEVTFAAQSINTKAFEGLQVSSIDDALQGQIAGLDVVGSGNIGQGASMRIRGTSSISANAEPLIVINGIPREDISTENFDFASASDQQYADLLSVNPEDIMEINVLKDAASTAVWGSKGASGVLLITTKKGVAGPTRINYTYKLTRMVQPSGIKMLSGDDYTMMLKEALFNPHQNNQSLPELDYLPESQFAESRYYSANTDWRKEVIQTGFTHDHYLAISGGGEKARFRVTGGLLNSDGTVIGQAWTRFTSSMDLNYTVSSRILFTAEFRFTYSDNKQNWSDARGDHEYINGKSILDLAYRKMPNLSVYDENGDYYTIKLNAPRPAGSLALHDSQKYLRNPVALARQAVNDLKSYDIQPTLRIRYDFFDPEEQMLRLDSWVSLHMKNEKTHKFLPQELSSEKWDHADINRSDDYDTENTAIRGEAKLQWKPNFSREKNSLILLGSVKAELKDYNSQTILAYGFPSSSITDPSAEGYLDKIESNIGQQRVFTSVGQIHYAYDSKYVASFTLNREGSTRFGLGNKFGYFYGVSLRWNIADEPFMDFSNGWLDVLSIRPGWGLSGKEPGSDYLHFNRYAPSGSYAGLTAIQPENIRLSNLKWEKTNGLNVGMDLSFLGDTYVVDFNYYRNRTGDALLKDFTIPTTAGYTTLSWRNSGVMDNIGWELNLQGNRFVQFGNFSMDFYLNAANSTNTLISLDPQILNTYNKPAEYKRDAAYMGKIQEGYAYGSIYGYRYKGVYEYNVENYQKGTAPVARNAQGDIIFQSNGQPLPMMYNQGGANEYTFQGGDAIYEDINHDGNIDDLDIVYLGNSNPKMNGGFGLTLRWKQFSCKAMFNFRYGNKIVNEARRRAERMINADNQSVAVNWRWREEGDQTPIPRALYDYGYNSLPSDRFVEDGSYLRFKHLTFNYTVPSQFLRKFSLKQMNVYMTFNNLYCFTNYRGVDPEVGIGGLSSLGISKDESTTPRARDFMLGVALGF
ncbi:MAG: SusC/RagA family TonB-linked outer membrane protein [Dysgonamonadaceae bacterium]|nr:SusC/RagA family TonB-linked outer membrane protein [Dysgonamonadaceae bacterium]